MDELDIPRDVSDLITPSLISLANGQIEIVDTPGLYPQLDKLTYHTIGPSLFYAYVLRQFLIDMLAQGHSMIRLIESYVNVYLDRPDMRARYYPAASGLSPYVAYQIYKVIELNPI